MKHSLKSRAENLHLSFNEEFESQNIDVEKLRPNKSYDFLIENRNGDLSDLLKDRESLSRFLVPRKCPTCESDCHTDLLEKDGLDIVECSDCRTVFVNPIFNEEKYQELYRSESYQEVVRNLGESSHEYRRDRFGKERASFVDFFHDPELPKTLLDIGCSTGFTLEAIQKRGWTAEGIELNPSAAEYGRSRNLTIHNQSVESFPIEEKFSAISLFDVLEHLVHPRKMLLKVKEMLHPGGNIFIYVPNWASASRDLIGEENCHFIWPTHHLTYFTPNTLKTFLSMNGFDVFHWETQGMDLIDVEWFLREKMGREEPFLRENLDQMQFYINQSGHGKNLRMYAKFSG